MMNECLLKWMKVSDLTQSLDGRDFIVLMHDGQRQAAVHSTAIDEDRAGATLPMVAPFLRTRQTQMFAAQIQDRRANIHVHVEFSVINGEVHAASAPVLRSEECKT
jgi:hypothetical protein